MKKLILILGLAVTFALPTTANQMQIRKGGTGTGSGSGTVTATNAVNSINGDAANAQTITFSVGSTAVTVPTFSDVGGGVHTGLFPFASNTFSGLIHSNDWREFKAHGPQIGGLSNSVSTVSSFANGATTALSNLVSTLSSFANSATTALSNMVGTVSSFVNSSTTALTNSVATKLNTNNGTAFNVTLKGGVTVDTNSGISLRVQDDLGTDSFDVRWRAYHGMAAPSFSLGSGITWHTPDESGFLIGMSLTATNVEDPVIMANGSVFDNTIFGMGYNIRATNMAFALGRDLKGNGANAGMLGRGLTNPVPNSIDIGMHDPAKLTVATNRMTIRTPVTATALNSNGTVVSYIGRQADGEIVETSAPAGGGGSFSTNVTALAVGTLTATNSTLRGVTNIVGNTGLVDFNGRALVRLIPNGSFTIIYTNVPAAGTPARSVQVEILNDGGHAGSVATSTVVRAEGEIVLLTGYNVLWYEWNGSNVIVTGSQEQTTGAGPTVLQSNPTINGQALTQPIVQRVTTNYAYASDIVIDLGTDVAASITNAVTGNMNILVTNTVPGNSFHLFLTSDGSARTINVFCDKLVTMISTNATANATQFLTVASKDMLINGASRRKTATSTNLNAFGAIQP